LLIENFEERSFGSTICRGKQTPSAWWFQKHNFSFRKVNKGEKRILASHLHCCFHLGCETANSCWQTVLDSNCRWCGKAFEHFAIAVDTAVWWAFTNCRTSQSF